MRGKDVRRGMKKDVGRGNERMETQKEGAKTKEADTMGKENWRVERNIEAKTTE